MRARGLTLFVAPTVLVCVLFTATHVIAAKKTVTIDGQAHALDFSKTVPNQLNYQGFLVNAADSSAVTATLEMTFRLFDSETKGAELWSETHPAVEVSNGLFQVLLGSITSFSSSLFDEPSLWLQTEVGSETLTPRKPLASVAYSQRAEEADQAASANWATEAQHAIYADTADYTLSAGVWTVDGDNVYRETGKVGIGTTSPLTELDVSGSVNAATYYGDGSHLTGIPASSDGDWTIDGSNMYSAVAGNVGIGVSDPAQELHVRSGSGWTTPLVDGSSMGALVLGDNDDALDEKYFAVWSNGEELALGECTDEVTYLAGRFVLLRNGDVGIGKYPSCRLDVSTNADTAAHFLTSWGNSSTIACYGEAKPGGNYNSKGIYGKCEASEGYGYGVYGEGGYMGVFGRVEQTGVSGHSYYGTRGYTHLSGSDGTAYGVYGYGLGGTATYGVYYSNGLAGSGPKSAIVRTVQGPMAVYCQESPENWFEDFGSGEIHGGQAEVQLAGDFRLTVTIDDSHPMKVFITPNADIGRWWVEKDNAGFILMAPDAPQGARFDYRVVAKRKGYEDIRLERTPAAYTDHFLYPSLDEVPSQYREEWIRSASPEVQAQYGLTAPLDSPIEEDIPAITRDSSLKKSR